MTVHVACTTWDKQFRLALVASSLPIDYKFESQEFYSKKTRVCPIYKKKKNEIMSSKMNYSQIKLNVHLLARRYHYNWSVVERAIIFTDNFL